MGEQKIFIVYRIYNKKERDESNVKSRFYGWSSNKNVIKAFLSQRTEGKYKYVKYYEDEESDELIQIDGYEVDTNNMINFVRLRSVTSGEYVNLFMTADEMQEAEKRIQRHFRNLCSIGNIQGKGDYLSMILSIDEYYGDALDFIGYRPPEISAMYPSADYRDDPGEIMGIDELIEEAYSGSIMSPLEDYMHDAKLPGLSTLTDVATKILYSVESFVKVLREDL